MLLPKSSSMSSLGGGDGGDLQQQQLSVTVINTQTLPTYSTERFYMLSEIELHGETTKFLCDYTEDGDCDVTLDTLTSLEDDQQQQQQAPASVILYLLWKPNTYSHSKDYMDSVVDCAVQKLLTILEPSSSSDREQQHQQQETKKEEEEEEEEATSADRENNTNTKIYLVVEKVIPEELFAVITSKEHDDSNHEDNNDDDDDGEQEHSQHSTNTYQEQQRQQQRQRLYQMQVGTAELLARQVATSPKFRSVLDGITVGLTDQFQAAPGLEACMNAILFGAKDRRKGMSTSHTNNSTNRSPIALFCEHPDDLLGVVPDENVVNMETDAVQGVLQSRSCAEWKGNGNIHSFASRAHREWHRKHGIPYMPSSPSRDSIKGKKRRVRRSGGGSGRRRKNSSKSPPDPDPDARLDASEQLATVMVWIFWAVVTSVLWNTYGEDAKTLLASLVGDV